MYVFNGVVCDRIIVVGVVPVFVWKDADSTYYIIGVLSVSRQMNNLLIAIGVENQAVFNEKRIVVIVRIYRDFDEYVKAVVCINLCVFERRS